LWHYHMVSAQVPTSVQRGTSEVKVEWTLLLPLYSCGMQTTVMYTHVLLHLEPKWHTLLHIKLPPVICTDNILSNCPKYTVRCEWLCLPSTVSWILSDYPGVLTR
jgi:hypothetical protein